jgi:ribosomal protein S18 acetylase RimI-like enzyme
VQSPVTSTTFDDVTNYNVRAANDDDDLVGIHVASWQPSSLPFAPQPATPLRDDAASSFSAATLSDLQSAWPYDRRLHLVAEAPDGSLAASCIVWFDATSRVGAIEPLGVHPEHRRRGLAGALCHYAIAQVRARQGREVVIHPRGDPGYPAALGAYQRVGFAIRERTRVFAPPT